MTGHRHLEVNKVDIPSAIRALLKTHKFSCAHRR